MTELIESKPSERRNRRRPVPDASQELDAGLTRTRAARERRARRTHASETRPTAPTIESRQTLHSFEDLRLRKSRKSVRTAANPEQNMPPVMARGGMEGIAMRKPKRNMPRRRYDVALGGVFGGDMPGAEVRLPSLPALRLSWRTVSGLAVLVLLGCLLFIWKAPLFQVSAVETDGLKRLTQADLNTVVDVVGKPVFLLSPRQVEKALTQAFPELAKVTVQVSLPNIVKITVVERQPVISWLQDGNEVWVDAEGVSFQMRGNPGVLVRVKAQSAPPSLNTTAMEPSSKIAALPGTPAVAVPSLRLPPEMVATILKLAKDAPSDAVLLYNTQHGLGWNDQHGCKIYFGSDDSDMDMKLAVYKALAVELEKKGIQPSLISVEYVHAPYYRTER